jgi:peptidoglycan/LPS O-acetylase OafA/YrhL
LIQLKPAKEGRVTFQERLVLNSFRGQGFDHIRIVAATIVLLHHCRGLQYPEVQNDPLMHYSDGFMDFGRFAVFIFFAIIGFLVTPSLLRTGDLVNYAVSRSLRIFPGLIVNVILSMLVLGPILTTYSVQSYFEFAALPLCEEHFDLDGQLSAWRGGERRKSRGDGALWTLHFEVLCYITLALASVFGLLKRRERFLAL